MANVGTWSFQSMKMTGTIAGWCLSWKPKIFSFSDERLSDFYIRAGDSFDPGSFDPTTFDLCHYQLTAPGDGETRTFDCVLGVAGKFVSVNFPSMKTDALHMCEVEVYGEVPLRPFLLLSLSSFSSVHIHSLVTCQVSCESCFGLQVQFTGRKITWLWTNQPTEAHPS